MTPLTFTKSYLNLRLAFSFLFSIIGIALFAFIEQIPENFRLKVTIIIFIVPFLLIYLYLESRKISRYPNDLVVNVETKTISLSSEKTYSFENIATLIITLKKYNYELYLKDSTGNILLETKDYYEANMHKNDISKYLTGITNINKKGHPQIRFI